MDTTKLVLISVSFVGSLSLPPIKACVFLLLVAVLIWFWGLAVFRLFAPGKSSGKKRRGFDTAASIIFIIFGILVAVFVGFVLLWSRDFTGR